LPLASVSVVPAAAPLSVIVTAAKGPPAVTVPEMAKLPPLPVAARRFSRGLMIPFLGSVTSTPVLVMRVVV
jgi:hypothetical protein